MTMANAAEGPVSPQAGLKGPVLRSDLIEPRAYQVNIANSCHGASTLVVLPTGMGKTIIALMVMAPVIEKGKKVLFMAPTKPLVEQHANSCRKFLDIAEEEVRMFTGETSRETRVTEWASAKVVVSTPQVVQNDIITGAVRLDDVGLIIFDEAHRSVGSYSYVFVAERYREMNPDGLVVGMTASPGSDPQKILEVCRNLAITNAEIRSEDDVDVAPYVHDIDVRWAPVSVPEDLGDILKGLKELYEKIISQLQHYALVRKGDRISTRDLLEAQRKIQMELAATRPNCPPHLFHGAQLQAMAMNVNQAIERAETQGLGALRSFLERLEEKAGSKGAPRYAKALIREKAVRRALTLSEFTFQEHPKVAKVREIVSEQLRNNPSSRIIVFTHYRDTSDIVAGALSSLEDDGVRPARFVGQASKGWDRGMSQKEQAGLIADFKAGKVNVLIATSVAEEGLDIPATDLVVMYEPVPSEIRTIQRKGRTGRGRVGRVEVLIARNTRDEAYYWSSKSKMRRMREEMDKLRKRLKKDIHIGEPELVHIGDDASASGAPDPTPVPGPDIQPVPAPVTNPVSTPASASASAPPSASVPTPASAPVPAKHRIIVDHREFRSQVVVLLSRTATIEPHQLEVGDYILSSRVGVERKEVGDFLGSLLDGRLFAQVRSLSATFERPLMIIEGKDLYTTRNIQPASVRGALASIMVDFGVPVFMTSGPEETAELLMTILRSENETGGHGPVLRSDKTVMGQRQRLEYVVQGLPRVSATLSVRLLEHFGTIQTIANSNVEKLLEVKGVGDKTALSIFQTLRTPYKQAEKEYEKHEDASEP